MVPDDAQGLKTLYGVHLQELRRFLIARTRDPLEVEEILQDLWIRLDTPAAGPIANGRAYLYRAAQNLVLDRVRERMRRMQRDRRWTDERTGYSGGATDVADPRALAEDEMLKREEAALLTSAIRNLPERTRQAFELHKLQELSHAEVARRMGISVSGVEKHMAAAMRYLRRALID